MERKKSGGRVAKEREEEGSKTRGKTGASKTGFKQKLFEKYTGKAMQDRVDCKSEG